MAVSVTIPVYNEAAVIEKVVNDCYREIIAKIHDSELIIVNDGSTDATPTILERLRLKFGQLKIINLPDNVGPGKALREALRQARKPLIFHIDGDDQFDIKDFWYLYALIDSNDIVAGYRSPRCDSTNRKIIALLLRWINIILFGVSLRDGNAPFKLMKSAVFRDIQRGIPDDFFATSLAVLLLARWKRYRVAEVPVAHFARKTGKTRVAGTYLIKHCILSLADLIKLKIRIGHRR